MHGFKPEYLTKACTAANYVNYINNKLHNENIGVCVPYIKATANRIFSKLCLKSLASYRNVYVTR